MTRKALGPATRSDPRWRADGDTAVIVTIVGLTFLARWLLADIHSYWYDEILSVDVYGHWHPTAFEAIRELAEKSVHPPLYQFLLYNWMSVVGDGEVATRSLSNLSIAVATFVLYRLVREVWDHSTAVFTAVVFSVLHTPLYYGLEARSYALSILLVVVSSFGLVRCLTRPPALRFDQFIRSGPLGIITAANTALLFTHYYNAFFWAAQGLFLGAFFLTRRQGARQKARAVGLTALAYAVPGAIFAALWGRAAVHHFSRHSGDYVVTDGFEGPVEAFVDRVVSVNFDVGWFFVGFVGVVAALAVTGAVRYGADRLGPSSVHRRWITMYAFVWLLMPIVLMHSAFAIIGVGRSDDRYYTYVAPALAVVFVLAVRGAVVQSQRALTTTPRWVRSQLVWTVFLIAAVIVVLPQTRDAAIERTYDWRSVAERAIEIVEGDPGSDYLVYEAGLRRVSLIDHYFHRLHDVISVDGTVHRTEERRGDPQIADHHDELVEHDYLVLLFPHARAGDFPNTLALLDDRYERDLTQLGEDERGLIVFRTNGGAREMS